MRPVRGGVAALVGVGGGDQAEVVGHAHPGPWRTPTPYLFLGFALLIILIGVALLVLVCTRRGSGAAEEASTRGATMSPLEREPKVAVFMSGDDFPSFIASTRPFALAAVATDASEQRKEDAA